MYRRILAPIVLASIVLAACASGSLTPGAKTKVSTGSNVSASLPADPASGTKSATLTFANVTAAGDASITPTTTAPTLPTGFALATNVYYDVATTATFDKATLCFENDKVTTRSKLYHFKDGAWGDRTTTVTPPKICGDFTSFSPVAIVEPVSSPSPTVAVATTAPATTAPATTAPATTAPATTAPATTAPATTAPAATTAAPTATQAPTATPVPTATPSPTPIPTPTPSPTPAAPFADVRFAANATGPVPSGFTRYSATVKDAATSAPIVGACVYTGPPAGCPRAGANTTDASGFFAVDLPSGSQFAFNIQSDPNNALYNAILQRTITGGSTQQLTMTHK